MSTLVSVIKIINPSCTFWALSYWQGPGLGPPVGEFRKTRHPRNVKFDKVLETCFSGAGNSRFSEAWNLWSFRKPGTWEASNSRMCEVRESWFSEEMGSRTCGSPEPRAGDGANFGGESIRESVEDPVRESRAKTCTNRWSSKGQFGNLSRTQFGSHAWRHSRTGGEAKSKLLSQKVRV
jgi:hypothetical protein